MKDIHNLTSKFISIYSIPLEEKWEEYFTPDHLNYFEYMVHSKITDTPDFDIANPATYRLSENLGLTTYLSKYSSYFNCDQMEGKVVVDVGCGWGFLSVWFLLCGAKEVDAIGFPYQITFIERLKKAAEKRNLLPAGGILRCIEQPLEKGNLHLGGLGPDHADLVAYSDVFEHIPDDIFHDAIIATFNTLKPGGQLISTCHNTDNKEVMDRTVKYWDQLEKDTFMAHRQRLILQKIPSIDSQSLKKLVELTRGMMLKEFNMSLENFQSAGTFPQQPSGLRPAVDLTYDYICENYISPSGIVKIMNKVGFKAYSYPGLRHSRRYMPFWIFEKQLGKILIEIESLSQTVVLVGKKT